MITNQRFKNLIQAYLANPKGDELKLRERIANILSEPQLHPSELTYKEWSIVGKAIKGAGFSVDVWDIWCGQDREKYPSFEKVVYHQWKNFDSEVSESAIFHLAKQKSVKNWLGYKITKQKGLDGKRRTAYILNYHEITEPQPISEEELAKLELVFEDDNYFPEQLIDRAPDPIAIWVDYVVNSHIRPNKTMAFASSLVTIGGLYHRRIRGPHNCMPNIYVMGVCDKGQGEGHEIECVDAFYKHLGMSSSPEYKGMIPDNRSGIGDTLVQAQGSIIYFFKQFPTKIFGKDLRLHKHYAVADMMDRLIELYTTPNRAIDTYPAGSKENIKIWYPHISLYSLSHPEIFYKLYTKNELLTMMVPIIANPTAVTQRTYAAREVWDIPEELIKLGQNIISLPRSTSATNPDHFNPILINFEDETVARFYKDRCNDILEQANKYATHGEIVVPSLYRALPQQALKVALIAHEGDVITRKVLEWAMEVAETSAQNVIQNAIRSNGTTVYESQMQRLYKDIKHLQKKNRGPVSKRDISRRSTWLDKSLRDKYLDKMVESNMLTLSTASTGGRPTRLYSIIRHKQSF